MRARLRNLRGIELVWVNKTIRGLHRLPLPRGQLLERTHVIKAQIALVLGRHLQTGMHPHADLAVVHRHILRSESGDIRILGGTGTLTLAAHREIEGAQSLLRQLQHHDLGCANLLDCPSVRWLPDHLPC